jgi:hypothetical protein
MLTVIINHFEISDIKYTWMPSPIHQNVINLVLRLSIRRGPVILMMLRWGNMDLLPTNYYLVTCIVSSICSLNVFGRNFINLVVKFQQDCCHFPKSRFTLILKIIIKFILYNLRQNSLDFGVHRVSHQQQINKYLSPWLCKIYMCTSDFCGTPYSLQGISKWISNERLVPVK